MTDPLAEILSPARDLLEENRSLQAQLDERTSELATALLLLDDTQRELELMTARLEWTMGQAARR